MKYRNSKKFSLDILVKEYRRDSIRNIVFLTVAMLAASIFLNNELIAIFLITYFVFGVSIIINTELVKRFIHD
jgi:diacylglycerol kinase